MNVLMIIRIAFRALARNKTRAALTMLGIIIGVSAVIVMVSIGQGAQASVQAQIESMGTNLLFVSAGAQNVGGVRSGTGDSGTNTLTVEDLDAIKREVPSVSMVSPVGNTRVQIAYVSAVSQEATYTAQQQIGELLRQRHKLTPSEADDFTVRNMSDVAEAANQTNSIMTILLGSIAGVSLLVGGIGIMNIMLVSVTERTREIGIRMAIGARSSAVRTQFLIESIVLSLTGGFAGILLGVFASVVVPAMLGWPTLVSTASVVGSVIFSAGVGIFFGYYPARKAAALDPIDALRSE